MAALPTPPTPPCETVKGEVEEDVLLLGEVEAPFLCVISCVAALLWLLLLLLL